MSTPQQAQPAVKPVVPTKAVAPAKVDLAQEYHYVFSDLRKIASIAAAMFVLLFVLAFVLRLVLLQIARSAASQEVPVSQNPIP